MSPSKRQHACPPPHPSTPAAVCNHPLLSRLHAEGAESGLAPCHPLPAEVRLCGKVEVLDRMLCKLRAGGHKVLWVWAEH